MISEISLDMNKRIAYKVERDEISELNMFIRLFQCELIDEEINKQTNFKNHKNWSSLISLIIITEIENKTGLLIDIESLRNSNTIEELYHSCKNSI